MAARKVSGSSDNYIPGVCNIGKVELEKRRQSLYMALIFLAIIVLIPGWFNINHIWRLIVFFPVVAVTVSLMQVYFKFCVSFGLKGVFNFAESGNISKVEEPEYVKKDKEKALAMIGISIIISVIISIIYYYL